MELVTSQSRREHLRRHGPMTAYVDDLLHRAVSITDREVIELSRYMDAGGERDPKRVHWFLAMDAAVGIEELVEKSPRLAWHDAAQSVAGVVYLRGQSRHTPGGARTWDVASQAAYYAGEAIAARHLFIRTRDLRSYYYLTAPWRAVMGELHPEDLAILGPSPKRISTLIHPALMPRPDWSTPPDDPVA